MDITKDCVVSIHYTLKNDHGDIIDSSQGSDPLQYLHGAGNIIPGLENALLNRKVGDAFDVTIAPGQGYGELRDDLIQTVPRSAFQSVEELKTGMRFQAQTERGTLLFTVTDIEGDDVTIDGNHELAGQKLYFSVEVVEVRQATAEELSHGRDD